MRAITSIPVVVDDDPDYEGFYSIFTNSADMINAELAGKIGERTVADRFAKFWNENLSG